MSKLKARITKKSRVRWDYEKELWLCIWEPGEIPRAVMRYWLMPCQKCGVETRCRWWGGLCEKCQREHYLAMNRISGAAHGLVTKAIKRGEIPAIDGKILCVDCNKPAQCYDHREYAKPLAVDPVCLSCNAKRGPAKEFETLWRRKRTVGHSPSLTKSA